MLTLERFLYQRPRSVPKQNEIDTSSQNAKHCLPFEEVKFLAFNRAATKIPLLH